MLGRVVLREQVLDPLSDARGLVVGGDEDRDVRQAELRRRPAALGPGDVAPGPARLFETVQQDEQKRIEQVRVQDRHDRGPEQDGDHAAAWSKSRARGAPRAENAACDDELERGDEPDPTGWVQPFPLGDVVTLTLEQREKTLRPFVPRICLDHINLFVFYCKLNI